MRLIAAILSVYILLLSVQPALFIIPTATAKEKKVMTCCVKKHHKADCGKEEKKDCCDRGKCNPFFSQCPICALVAVTGNKFPELKFTPVYNIKAQFFSRDQHMKGDYSADLLRPPAVV